MAPNGKSINCRDVCLKFGEQTQVLRRINLHVPGGRIVSLVGPSGCGKTTLLKCIAQLLPIDSGVVQIDDHDFSAANVATRQIAYVFQEPALLPWRTAIENITLPLQLLRLGSTAEQMNQAMEVLQVVELSLDDAQKYPHQLSGGMKMRVSLARALITDPAVLLLDEPFAALDDMLRTRLTELVIRLHRRRGCTIVLVTHNIGEAVLMSHEVAVMDRGRIGGHVTINLPSDRDSSLRRTPKFAELYGEVADRLQEAIR